MIFIAERYTTRQIPVVVLIVVAVLLQVYQSPMLKILAVIFIPIIIIRVGQASWPEHLLLIYCLSPRFSALAG